MSRRNEIEQLVIANAGQSFAGDDFRMLNKPCVYMFLQQCLPIYIGMSGNGIARPAQVSHHRGETARAECDEVRIYPCLDVRKAIKLESILIAQCQPKYNKRKKYSRISKRLGLQRVSSAYPQASEGPRPR